MRQDNAAIFLKCLKEFDAAQQSKPSNKRAPNKWSAFSDPNSDAPSPRKFFSEPPKRDQFTNLRPHERVAGQEGPDLFAHYLFYWNSVRCFILCFFHVLKNVCQMFWEVGVLLLSVCAPVFYSFF